MQGNSALPKNPRAHFAAHRLTNWITNPATALGIADQGADGFTYMFPNAFCI